MIKAIETRYKGYRFRSRLEARWAVFFDALHIPWEYEKEGFDLGSAGRYLPDFWLPSLRAWVEVKPIEVQHGSPEWLKARSLANADRPVIIGQGMPDNDALLFAHDCGDSGGGSSEWDIYLGWIAGSIIVVAGDCLDFRVITDAKWNQIHWVIGIEHRLSHQYRARPEFNNAVADARAARFEHGESGHAH